ncbi:DUF4892 domain-containing protein [Pseudomonas corrugata]|uniref:DUF4892 domain-containing protein n=1 Tax=Pseudomonas corrugata TaxID=47879 RepID=A0A3M3DX94_9PSED|nr:DUF4892 domain-containing protein [Pseudomonas corrugata]AOE61595.1 hypothetical protein AXG94_07435 [Pseudomonas corrugata]MDU9023886.1 DUF4892 domain-containing protein [Pseudomonas corrugata]MDU9036866.1 DUF4892 domain-containing protein [Pseudomonas corrugata]MDU9039625.1 DUF4892 domain-containing protein [Pseudomonas corrugata]QTH12825.1 DUF4892 domain-containing protein [Pseudomonas corrugata]
MKSFVHSLTLLALACVSPASFAADVPGSRDLERVPRLPDAQIVDYRQTSDVERIYPLGSIRKISGQLRFDGQVDGRGVVTSVTYELPPEHSATQAFTAAREALQQQGAELLFWCQARDCGESSLWANEVFGNAKLYGADNGQAYLLLRLAPPTDNTLIALYGITRGNRKAYLHVEQFEASTPLGDLLPTSATLLRQLKDTGVLDLPRLAGEPDETWLRLLARALNLDTGLRVSLAGPKAEAWRQALSDQGVREARMEAAGDGNTPGLHLELLR